MLQPEMLSAAKLDAFGPGITAVNSTGSGAKAVQSLGFRTRLIWSQTLIRRANRHLPPPGQLQRPRLLASGLGLASCLPPALLLSRL